jgi:hypothetical protein
MTLSAHVALVAYQVPIEQVDLMRVAGAISKQVTRDFGPIWKVNATVDAFASLDEVPADYWPVVVVPSVQSAAGYHQDENGQPYALVQADPDWSLTASHECLEMLADPFGRRLRAGNMLPQAVALGLPQRRVRYLVEICDPSESGAFSYQVNGVTVSDFYTPAFFDPMQTPGARYSFTGAVPAPRDILKGGYVSWHDPSDKNWYQLRNFPDKDSSQVPHVVNLTTHEVLGGVFQRTLREEGPRAASDRVTKHPYHKEIAGPARERAELGTRIAEQAHNELGSSLRKTIDAILAKEK